MQCTSWRSLPDSQDDLEAFTGGGWQNLLCGVAFVCRVCSNQCTGALQSVEVELIICGKFARAIRFLITYSIAKSASCRNSQRCCREDDGDEAGETHVEVRAGLKSVDIRKE